METENRRINWTLEADGGPLQQQIQAVIGSINQVTALTTKPGMALGQGMAAGVREAKSAIDSAKMSMIDLVAVTQKAGDAAGDVNRGGRGRQGFIEISRAAQDFAIVLQSGGGLDRALIGAANNLGVLATMLGTAGMVAATVAVIALPMLVRSIMQNSEAFKSATQRIEEYTKKAKDAQSAQLTLASATDKATESQKRFNDAIRTRDEAKAAGEAGDIRGEALRRAIGAEPGLAGFIEREAVAGEQQRQVGAERAGLAMTRKEIEKLHQKMKLVQEAMDTAVDDQVRAPFAMQMGRLRKKEAELLAIEKTRAQEVKVKEAEAAAAARDRVGRQIAEGNIEAIMPFAQRAGVGDDLRGAFESAMGQATQRQADDIRRDAERLQREQEFERQRERREREVAEARQRLEDIKGPETTPGKQAARESLENAENQLRTLQEQRDRQIAQERLLQQLVDMAGRQLKLQELAWATGQTFQGVIGGPLGPMPSLLLPGI